MTAPAQVYEIYIRTNPERLWQALTDGELTKQYYYGTELRSDLAVGSPFVYFDAGDKLQLDGEILEILHFAGEGALLDRLLAGTPR